MNILAKGYGADQDPIMCKSCKERPASSMLGYCDDCSPMEKVGCSDDEVMKTFIDFMLSKTVGGLPEEQVEALVENYPPHEMAKVFAETIKGDIEKYPRVKMIHDRLLAGDADHMIAAALWEV